MRIKVPKASDWKARGNAFVRSAKGWDQRLDGQEGVSGVAQFRWRRLLYYIGASGNRPQEKPGERPGPANRALGVAIDATGKGLRFKTRKQPILRHQPHGNVEEGIFSCKPLNDRDDPDGTLWLFVGAIESDSKKSTKVDVFVDLYRTCDGIALEFVKRVYGGKGKEAWPLAVTWVGNRVHLWVGKVHPATLLTGPHPTKLKVRGNAKIPIKNNSQPFGHGAVDLGDGVGALLCDKPTRLLTMTKAKPTTWKEAAVYPSLKEGDIGKALIVGEKQWAAYLLAPDDKSVKAWTAAVT